MLHLQATSTSSAIEGATAAGRYQRQLPARLYHSIALQKKTRNFQEARDDSARATTATAAAAPAAAAAAAPCPAQPPFTFK